MNDHITLRVENIDETKMFYVSVLSPLGYRCGVDETDSSERVLGFVRDGKFDTWFTTGKPISGPCHIAWRANSRDDVDAFYRAAIAAGAQDNGEPGIREHFHPGYYSAFVIDPNGQNIEVVCHLLLESEL